MTFVENIVTLFYSHSFTPIIDIMHVDGLVIIITRPSSGMLKTPSLIMHIVGSVQNCDISIANALEIPQSCTEPSIVTIQWHITHPQPAGGQCNCCLLSWCHPSTAVVAAWLPLHSTQLEWPWPCLGSPQSLLHLPVDGKQQYIFTNVQLELITLSDVTWCCTQYSNGNGWT